ncbi:MAG: histidine kinase [Firmicutes bacterium]|nr:histidine kinase [Bacillota bacterium]
MRTIRRLIPMTIRSKLLVSFLTMIAIFTLVGFFSYYSERYLLNRVNTLLTNNITLKEFSVNINNTITFLEQYLISRNFIMLQEYFRESQEVDAMYPNLAVIQPTMENYLLLENIRNMTRSFLQQADAAVQAKRARDSSAYSQAFFETVRYGTNINWAIDRLITSQLEENSRQYLIISQRLVFIQRLGLILIIGALIFSVLVTVWTSFRLTNPLMNLVEAAGNISKGKFDMAPLKVTTNDEVGVVTKAFNEMAADIAKLILKIKEQSDLAQRLQDQELQNLTMKNILREAELHALQSQINPHFLFNMLNAGVQLAIIEDADQTADYIDKAASLLRYNLRRLDTPVTLAEEFDHLNTYFFILSARYGKDRIKFNVELDPAIADFQLPLLTLQPIVENALIHGVEDMESGGMITVRAFSRDNLVIIQIQDNGKGMDWETLQSLRDIKRSAGHTTGLGLHNVRERLRLFFQAEDLLQISMVPEGGVLVELRLPLLKVSGKEGEDENTGS